MEKLVSLCIMFFCYPSFGFDYPWAKVIFTGTPATTVFYGETLRIPVQMDFRNLREHKLWTVPVGSSLEVVSGYCPSIPYHIGTHWIGTCNMNIVVPGDSLGKVVSGNLHYQVWGESGHKPHHYSWTRGYDSPWFFVSVIPHPLSMLPIPIQEATANQAFIYNLKSTVMYYDENLQAGKPAQGLVIPAEQDGLRFDPASFSIRGTPQRTGNYHFTVVAQNATSTTAPVNLRVQVNVNLKDKPVFKQHQSIGSAMPDHKYTMNLMELIEPTKGFMVTNQISFRLVPNPNNPDWLYIPNDDTTLLMGDVPKNMAGQEVTVGVIATSNTGGDSEIMTIKIPIAYDPTKKPVINKFKLEELAGMNISENLSNYINDPAHDEALKVILDKIEPAAPWLRISSHIPNFLEGFVPPEATGQLFQLTLRANTSIGGSSEPITIPLQISVDPKQTSRFKKAYPVLPMLYPEQPFLYDFVVNQDIYPEYEEIPYEVKFAEGYEPPAWLRIEDNKLIADLVPSNIENEINVNVVIKNIPGGISKVYLLNMKVMN